MSEIRMSQPTWRERTEARIGRDLRDRYRNLQPLLDLIEYRMEDVDAADDYRYGLSRLFLLDTLYGKKATTRAVADLICPLLWTLSKRMHRKTRKADPRLLFSNTFLLSARYPAAREQIENETGCTAILTFSDFLKREPKNQQILLRDSLHPQTWRRKPVYFKGRSICGGALQKAIIRFAGLVYDPAVPAEEKTEACIEQELQKLEKVYTHRISKLEDCLRKEDCSLYFTVNQYNLRDVMIMHACRNLGIRTFQQEHHAMQFCRVQFDENDPSPRLAFASEFGFWNKTDRLFHEKIYRYESPLYRPEEIRFRVTGNPEMDYEEAIRMQQKYPPERKLTFMIAALPEAEIEEAGERYGEWRWQIFKGLKELADRQHVIINIRYTPNAEMAYREKEVPVLKEWGFRISESVPSNLMEDLCSSAAILSSVSSVLCTARMFGKLTFRVSEWEMTYIHVDDEIHEVAPEDIPNIVIPEGIENLPPKIDPEAAFSIKRIK